MAINQLDAATLAEWDNEIEATENIFNSTANDSNIKCAKFECEPVSEDFKDPDPEVDYAMCYSKGGFCVNKSGFYRLRNNTFIHNETIDYLLEHYIDNDFPAAKKNFIFIAHDPFFQQLSSVFQRDAYHFDFNLLNQVVLGIAHVSKDHFICYAVQQFPDCIKVYVADPLNPTGSSSNYPEVARFCKNIGYQFGLKVEKVDKKCVLQTPSDCGPYSINFMKTFVSAIESQDHNLDSVSFLQFNANEDRLRYRQFFEDEHYNQFTKNGIPVRYYEPTEEVNYIVNDGVVNIIDQDHDVYGEPIVSSKQLFTLPAKSTASKGLKQKNPAKSTAAAKGLKQKKPAKSTAAKSLKQKQPAKTTNSEDLKQTTPAKPDSEDLKQTKPAKPTDSKDLKQTQKVTKPKSEPVRSAPRSSQRTKIAKRSYSP